MDPKNEVKDVIVIGAGVSGLSCAKFLSDQGIKNLNVIEANKRVGGRTLTVNNNETKYCDLGGAYIGVTQNHLHRLIKELKIETYKIDESCGILIYDHDRNYRSVIKSDQGFDIGCFLANLDINNFLRKLDQIGDEINVKEPWNSKRAIELDRMTYQELIDKTCYTKLGKKFAKGFININVTCEPYESSLLWFCWYIKQCGGVKRIISTTGGGQDSKTIGGMQQLSTKMVEKIGENKILLGDPVIYINYKATRNQTNCCLIKTVSGKTYFAKKVILALPPTNQNKISFEPTLPPKRIQLMQRYPMGCVMKTIIFYEKCFWKEQGYSGSMLQLGEDPNKSPFFYTLDDTKPDGSKPAIIGFILADKLRALIDKTKEERKNLIAQSLYKVFDNELALRPIHYEEHTMLNEQYIGGCYTSFAPPGFLTNFGEILRKNIDKKIFFAGTETSFNWSGYINGAIDSGERAAREVLVELGKLSPDKIWVEEPCLEDYPKHEFKNTLYELYAPSAENFVKFGYHIIGGLAIVGLTYLHIRMGCIPTTLFKK